MPGPGVTATDAGAPSGIGAQTAVAMKPTRERYLSMMSCYWLRDFLANKDERSYNALRSGFDSDGDRDTELADGWKSEGFILADIRLESSTKVAS